MKYRRHLWYSGSLVLFVFSLLLVSCVTTGQGSSGSNTVITQEEIEQVGGISNAYNLVRRLHPQWLQKRGRNSLQNPGDIIVYVEDAEQGGPEALRAIDLIDVQSIEFLRPDKATMLYGGGHDNGAIQVHLKDGRS